MTDLDNQWLVAATRRPGPRRERAEREPDIAQHSSKLEAAIARPTSLERQLDMDTARSDERKTVATVRTDLEQGITSEKTLTMLRTDS